MSVDFSVAALGLLVKKARIVGSKKGSVPLQRVITTYANLHLDGRPTLDLLISGRIAREQVNEGQGRLMAGESERSTFVQPAINPWIRASVPQESHS